MFEQAFRNIDDVLRREGGGVLKYTEQSSWLLFLRYLDSLEQDGADQAALEGKTYDYILDKPYRWSTWAAPKDGPDAGELGANQLRQLYSLGSCEHNFWGNSHFASSALLHYKASEFGEQDKFYQERNATLASNTATRA